MMQLDVSRIKELEQDLSGVIARLDNRIGSTCASTLDECKTAREALSLQLRALSKAYYEFATSVNELVRDGGVHVFKETEASEREVEVRYLIIGFDELDDIAFTEFSVDDLERTKDRAMYLISRGKCFRAEIESTIGISTGGTRLLV